MTSAMRSRLDPFKRFVRMLRSHLDGVLPWTRIRLSNAAVEGMNNKIKSISHRSFGFSTAENFIQHESALRLWAANTLVPNLAKPVIKALGLTWCDLPVEREARIITKRI